MEHHTEITRESLHALDREDPLASCRAEFDLPDGLVYLDGNSLGVLTHAAAQRLPKVVAEWRDHLVGAWNSAGWIDLPNRIGAKIARLIGANADEVVCTDSTSINLFKVVAAALELQPGRHTVLSEKGNFPTDLYILQGLTDLKGPAARLVTVERDAVLARLNESVAVLVLTHVHYRTAAMYDMAAVTRAAHEKGVLVVWDLCHSAGAVELDLSGSGADFAVGCGYKYLNGGPGAPAYVFAARRHQQRAGQPLSGWLGHSRPFDFMDAYEPAPGIGRFLCGAQSVLSMAPLESALGVFDRVSMGEIRAKSQSMRRILLELLKSRCTRYGFGFETEEDAASRGSHVSIMHEESYAICQALIRRRVVADFRAPDALRLGLTPLYLRYVDLWDGVEQLVQVMEHEEWAAAEARVRHAVT